MKLTQDVRDYANGQEQAQLERGQAQAELELGMEAKAKEFREGGGELYVAEE
jgi:hypothetical protein